PYISLAYGLAYENDRAERERTIDHLLLHDSQIRRLCHRPTESEPDEVAFWATWFSTSENQIRTAIAMPNSWIDKVNTNAQEFRPRFEKSVLLALEIWTIEDSFQRIEFTAILMSGTGFVLALVGFILWYLRVQ